MTKIVKSIILFALSFPAGIWGQVLYVTDNTNLYRLNKDNSSLGLVASAIQQDFFGYSAGFYENTTAYIYGTRNSSENVAVSSIRSISLENGQYSDLNLDRVLSSFIKNGSQWFGLSATSLYSISSNTGVTQHVATINQSIHGWGSVAFDQDSLYILAGKGDPLSKVIRKVNLNTGMIEDLDINNSSMDYIGMINGNIMGCDNSGSLFSISSVTGQVQLIESGLFSEFDGVAKVQFDDAQDKIFIDGIKTNPDSTISGLIKERDATSGATTTLETQNRFSYLLVPEPSALSLLAIGLGALALVRRRRS